MDRLAINKRTALKMYWDAGFNTESLLEKANNYLKLLKQPTDGFYYADDVSISIGVHRVQWSKID